MATVNFSVPDDLKDQFNKVFSHQNKSHIIAELMKQAIEEYERRQQRVQAINALLKLRAQQQSLTDAQIKKAREEGRP